MIRDSRQQLNQAVFENQQEFALRVMFSSHCESEACFAEGHESARGCKARGTQ